MSHPRRCFGFASLVLALLLVSGCGSGPKGPSVTGKLVMPPNVKLAENDYASLIFMPDTPDGKGFSGVVNTAAMTFVARGPTGKGVTPGKYRIIVKLQPYQGGESAEKAILEDINTRYDEGNSPLKYDVTDAPEQAITVDLAQGTVTKQ